MARVVSSRVAFLLCALLFAWTAELLPSDTVAVVKKHEGDVPGGKHTCTCSVNMRDYANCDCPITITSIQKVRWTADLTDDWTGGAGFYLTTDIPATGGACNPRVLFEVCGNLHSCKSPGEVLLQPGTYYIAIRSECMGTGTYTIEYNISSGDKASISVAPKSGNISMGQVKQGSPASPKEYTISSTGSVPVAIESIELELPDAFDSSGPSRKTVTAGAPTEFSVRWRGLSRLPGRYSSTITVRGRTQANELVQATSEVVIEVVASSPVEKKVTILSCLCYRGLDCPAPTPTAEWCLPQKVILWRQLAALGPHMLTIADIKVINDSGEAVFTLEEDYTGRQVYEASPLDVKIGFTPRDELTYRGSLVVSTTDGRTWPVCSLIGVGHHAAGTNGSRLPLSGGLANVQPSIHEEGKGFFSDGCLVRQYPYIVYDRVETYTYEVVCSGVMEPVYLVHFTIDGARLVGTKGEITARAETYSPLPVAHEIGQYGEEMGTQESKYVVVQFAIASRGVSLWNRPIDGNYEVALGISGFDGCLLPIRAGATVQFTGLVLEIQGDYEDDVRACKALREKLSKLGAIDWEEFFLPRPWQGDVFEDHLGYRIRTAR